MGFLDLVVVISADLKFILLATHQARDGNQDHSIVFNIKVLILVIKVSRLFLVFVLGRPPVSIFNSFEERGLENVEEAVGIFGRLKYSKAMDDGCNRAWIKEYQLDQESAIQLFRVNVFEDDPATSMKCAGDAIC
ncbi:hypothetical protein WT60_05045 [Burkholderia sp. MSMB617WGS]|nr:hypothetical protein WT60_05045 [Burkholderia sp. MSMB617WGS]